MARKPAWTIEKERAARSNPRGDTVWLFGIHAVRDALVNPARRRETLILTPNAADRLGEIVAQSGMTPRIVDPRRFDAPLEAQSVHQGAALEAHPLDWGSVSEVCAPRQEAPLVLLLDRVSDPHNVGAILRSAEVFGARAVIAPHRHSSPETGALAKAASGALERQPYLRVPNLARAMGTLQDMGYAIVGLDGTGDVDLETALAPHSRTPVALALGAEGPGLRELTRKLCDTLARIPAAGSFGSLNVSNAAAVALYAAAKTPRAPEIVP
jgi:23S rRNA (guanosine2251-2'-O)-methyltransferase